MIKQIKSSEDIEQAIGLIKLFLADTVYKDLYPSNDNTMHLGKLIHAIAHSHYAWLGLVNDEPVGLLLAVKENNIWAPTQCQMRELVWYVKPEYRNTTIGGKLFLEYCRRADELLKDGTIQGYFTTRMTNTDQMNLERRGFRLMEQTYLKELKGEL